MIPVLLGAIVMVHGPRWSFVPTEAFPMGGMEFQVVLLLLASWFLIVGNGEARLAMPSRVQVSTQSQSGTV